MLLHDAATGGDAALMSTYRSLANASGGAFVSIGRDGLLDRLSGGTYCVIVYSMIDFPANHSVFLFCSFLFIKISMTVGTFLVFQAAL